MVFSEQDKAEMQAVNYELAKLRVTAQFYYYGYYLKKIKSIGKNW